MLIPLLSRVPRATLESRAGGRRNCLERIIRKPRREAEEKAMLCLPLTKFWRRSVSPLTLRSYGMLEADWSRWDDGLNPLFDDRAEEHIKYEEEIEKVLKRTKGKRPDRIVGLRATSRIERILKHTEAYEEDSNRKSITISPFSGPCQPLLFPFLVLEAKSEKSSDTFSKIYLQTGFAIRALLNLQRDLLNATTENQQYGMKPLVWFLANKGEDWRVYGAYLEEEKGSDGQNYVSQLTHYLVCFSLVVANIGALGR